jgi:hypothetical protein
MHLETRTNHKGLSQPSKERRSQTTDVSSSQKLPLLHVSDQGTNFKEIHYLFKSSLRICSRVPYKRPNLLATSKMVLCLHAQFVTFHHIFNYVTCGEMTSMLTIFSYSFPTPHFRKPLKSLVLPMALSPKAVLSISHVSSAVHQIPKQDL